MMLILESTGSFEFLFANSDSFVRTARYSDMLINAKRK